MTYRKGAVKDDAATGPDPVATTCPWCKGSCRCATCEGTGEHVVKTRILRRTRTADCRACEGTGVCQLCKRPHTPR